MNKKKDIFAEVEEAAKKKLTDPDCKGAARTVLNYISEQRKKHKMVNKTQIKCPFDLCF